MDNRRELYQHVMSNFDDIFGKGNPNVDLGKFLNKKKDEPSTIALLITLFVLLFLYIPTVIWLRPFAFMILWNWFMPLIGFTPIGFALSFGILVIIGLANGIQFANSKAQSEKIEKLGDIAGIWYGMVAHIVSPLLAMGLGYIAHLFV